MMRHLRPLIALCTSLPVCSVFAAIPPDAGRQIHEIETTPLSIPAPQTLDLTLPDSAEGELASGGPTLQVRDFRISGSQAIATSELLPLLDDLKGRNLSLADLQRAARRLSDYYRQHGYPLARAYLPAQEIDQGIVEIAVLEGRYGQVNLQNSSRVSDRVLSAPLAPLESGSAVEGKELERSLLLLQDTPGVEVKSTLRPGTSVGTSDLIVETAPAPLISGSIDADNYGNRYMGQNRLGLTLNLNSPLGLGDLLSLRGMRSDEGQDYHRASYQLPVGPYGTQLGAAYSEMDYELSKDFDELDAHGKARISTAFVLQPLIRSRAFNLYGQLQFEDKFLEDDIDLFSSRSDKRLRNWSATLSGNGQDSFNGGAVSSFALTYTHGDLNIGSGDVEQLDAATTRTQGTFNKWNLAILRLQRLTDRLSLYAQVQGQLSDGNLDSAEKFWLGGPYGVRAYPQGEATGDQGWLANVELRYALTPAWQLSTFIDHGHIRLNEDTWDDGENHRRLSGAGVGVNWSDHGWRVNAVSAWKLGSERTESDVNRTPRVWVQVVRYF